MHTPYLFRWLAEYQLRLTDFRSGLISVQRENPGFSGAILLPTLNINLVCISLLRLHSPQLSPASLVQQILFLSLLAEIEGLPQRVREQVFY